MPKYYFNDDDIFYNLIRAHPRFVTQFYLNNAYINKEIAQGTHMPNGVVSYFETAHSNSPFVPYVVRGNNATPLYPIGSGIKLLKQYANLPMGGDITGSFPITASIERHLVISGGLGPVLIDGVTTQRTVNKIKNLYAAYNAYAPLSPTFNFNNTLMLRGGKIAAPASGALLVPPNINLIEIPRILFGNQIKRGSVDLKFYYTGTLIAQANDFRQSGELIETVGPRTGTIIGNVMYNEGILLLTASYNLYSGTDGYLSPVSGTFTDPSDPVGGLQPSWVATSSWAYFGAYESFITTSLSAASSSFAPMSSSYVLDFKGTNKTPTLLMTAHAQKNDLNWSNNPTFIERQNEHSGSSYHDIYVAGTGSDSYIEKEKLLIKNTVSSSFCDYSASYKPQTYITKIGVYDSDGDLIAMGKFANPVRKTNEQDYTFKLKLDL